MRDVSNSLRWAIRTKTHERFKVLVNEGADVNSADHDLKNTALHVAAEKGAEDLVSFLIDKGANAQLKNKAGQTAIDVACNEEIKALMMNEVKAHNMLCSDRGFWTRAILGLASGAAAVGAGEGAGGGGSGSAGGWCEGEADRKTPPSLPRRL